MQYSEPNLIKNLVINNLDLYKKSCSNVVYG